MAVRGGLIPPPVYARRTQDVRAEQELATLLTGLCLGAAVAIPGSLVGLTAAWLIWLKAPTGAALRWVTAALGAASLALHSAVIAWGWPLRLLLAYVGLPSVGARLSSSLPTWPGVLFEAAAGPALLQLLGLTQHLRGRQPRHRLYLEQRAMRERELRGRAQGHASLTTPPAAAPHPLGVVRLGTDLHTGHTVHLRGSDLRQHVFVVGATDSGKTTTVSRLVEGTLALGWSWVIVDLKGGGMASAARALADSQGLPFRTVDPDAQDTLGYDVCAASDGPAIANKLVGALEYSGEAIIYRNIALEFIAVVVRAMRAAGETVTLETIHATLTLDAVGRLARSVDAPLRERLLTLIDKRAKVRHEGLVGIHAHLGALLEGRFGALLTRTPAFDWDRCFARPSVAYIRLPASEVPEDVDFMSRVLLQDAKQATNRRLLRIAGGETLFPAGLVLEELASVSDPPQAADLLRQAREAETYVVISTHHLPEDPKLLRDCLSTGLILAHRVSAADAEMLAAQWGTHGANRITQQVDYESGMSEWGSAREVEHFVLHPNELRGMPRGTAAMLSIAQQRSALVRIDRPELQPRDGPQGELTERLSSGAGRP